MRPFLFVLALAVTLAAQDHQQPTWDPPPDPPEAYPGQRTHQQPPEGWNCERQTIRLDVPPEHACTCERMYDPDDPTVVREDQHCTVYCHAYACKCGIGGHPPDAAPPLPDPR